MGVEKMQAIAVRRRVMMELMAGDRKGRERREGGWRFRSESGRRAGEQGREGRRR